MVYRRFIEYNASRHLIARYILAVLGLVLIGGGAITLYDSAIAVQEDDSTTLLFMLFSEVECFGGFWLLLGNHSEQTRHWVVAFFLGLSISSLYQVLTGRCSCGCFGSWPVNPWVSLIFALITVAVLLKWLPSQDRGVTSITLPRMLGLGLIALLTGLAGVCYQPLVVVAGTATLNGRPLAETTLVFAGNSVAVPVRTDHDGFFQLPPVRPGQYTVSISGSDSGAPPQPQPPERDPVKKKGPEKTRRQSSRASLKGNLKNGRGSSQQPPRPDDDTKIILLKISDCSEYHIQVNFD
jgi:hypothetical protein